MSALSLDTFLAFGSRGYWLLFGLVILGRACDLGSTFLATPHLRLEANPVARRLGWRFGIPVNLLLSGVFATWPLLAIAMTTLSFLVAARNLQSAWIMRSMGEHAYRHWIGERVNASPRGLPLSCCLAEAVLFCAIGAGLLLFARDQLMPSAVGMGILGYSLAVAIFTSLAFARSRD